MNNNTVWCVAVILGIGGQPPPTLTPLEAAIVKVESGGNNKAVGDGGRAIGPFQTWKVVVTDCNRIVGHKRWTNEDRWDLEKSRDMFRLYTEHYAPHGTNEQKARVWNGGPKGPSKPATEPYWQKVNAILVHTNIK